MDKHWSNLASDAVNHLTHGQPTPHLNMYLSRDQIVEFSKRIGLKVARFIEPEGDAHSIGQSIVLLKNLETVGLDKDFSCFRHFYPELTSRLRRTPTQEM